MFHAFIPSWNVGQHIAIKVVMKSEMTKMRRAAGGEVLLIIIISFFISQADVCHAYQILRRNGVPPENIIVMMYDDIANNSA